MTIDEKRQAFKDWAFGMFIHYGLYSVHGRGEWLYYKERMPDEDYFKVKSEFKPQKGCQRKWAELAKRAGMKYMILTTRHHDGYFLGEEFIREYCEACREFGLGVGLYYSVTDWSDRDFRKGALDTDWKNFVKKAHDQLTHLMTNYGKIDYLFYDGCPYPETWEMDSLHQKLRELQPELLISCRCRREEDVHSSEGHCGAHPGKVWESCYTLNNSWGYNKYDKAWKSPEELIRLLFVLRHNGGNLLLNVAPMADGSIQKEEIEILDVIGGWLEKNGEAVYEVQPYPFEYYDQELSTASGNSAYIYFPEYFGPEHLITGIGNEIQKITLLNDGRDIAFKQEPERLSLLDLGFRKDGELPRILKLNLDGEPVGIRNSMMPDLNIRTN
jgi:alpha-L-fucosidase